MALKLIKRNGGKIWWIRGTLMGVPVYESTRLTKRRHAELVRLKVEDEILSGRLAGRREKLKQWTFGEAAKSYLAGGGSARFLAQLETAFGHKRLDSIAPADLRALSAKLYPLATPATRNRQFYTPFIAVWNHAARNGWASVRLWERPRKPIGTNFRSPLSGRTGTAPVDYYTAATFVAAMSPDPAMLMTLLFYTGLRPIEALALQAGDVDADKQWLVVRNSKTGHPRGVPLHSFLCEWLPSLIERGGTLFRTPRGEPYRKVQDGGGGLKTAIKGARRRSGINEVSPYTARHTVSTQLVIEGVHPHMKDQILGHAADDMSRRYTNVPQAPLIEAIGRLPVPAGWRALPWVASPTDWFGKLAEGTGKRTDLERKNLPK